MNLDKMNTSSKTVEMEYVVMQEYGYGDREPHTLLMDDGNDWPGRYATRLQADIHLDLARQDNPDGEFSIVYRPLPKYTETLRTHRPSNPNP